MPSLGSSARYCAICFLYSSAARSAADSGCEEAATEEDVDDDDDDDDAVAIALVGCVCAFFFCCSASYLARLSLWSCDICSCLSSCSKLFNWRLHSRQARRGRSRNGEGEGEEEEEAAEGADTVETPDAGASDDAALEDLRLNEMGATDVVDAVAAVNVAQA